MMMILRRIELRCLLVANCGQIDRPSEKTINAERVSPITLSDTVTLQVTRDQRPEETVDLYPLS